MSSGALFTPQIDEDYVVWLEHQIATIRERDFARLDVENLLDELEFTVSERKRDLRGGLRGLMLNLLKCAYHPTLRSNSWIATICTRRHEIEDVLEESPSLVSLVPGFIETEYKRAVHHAMVETGAPRATYPASSPYAEQQLFDFDFIPGLRQDNKEIASNSHFRAIIAGFPFPHSS